MTRKKNLSGVVYPRTPSCIQRQKAMQQKYFSDTEWLTLLQAPGQAALAVILADKTDPVNFLKELRLATQILHDEQNREDISNSLINSLNGALNESDASTGLQPDDLLLRKEFNLMSQIRALASASEGRKLAIAHIKQVAEIMASKLSVNEATEVKTWLMSVAQKVAEAVKEEGFLGIGGERISGSEHAVLSDLEKALALKA